MTDQTRRFATADDTPCPFRLGRFGYARTGEFRTPRQGELYIQPTEGPELQEHEPVILGACQDHEGEERHIVVAIPEETREALAAWGVLALLVLTEDEAQLLFPEARS